MKLFCCLSHFTLIVITTMNSDDLDEQFFFFQRFGLAGVRRDNFKVKYILCIEYKILIFQIICILSVCLCVCVFAHMKAHTDHGTRWSVDNLKA